MDYDLVDFEALAPQYASHLSKAGIHTLKDLLHMGKDPLVRRQVAQESGFGEPFILKWVELADLFRIPGISIKYSELIHACGVKSAADLASRNPKKLLKKMMFLNKGNKICNLMPKIKAVEEFINQAKRLPKTNFA